MRLRHIWRSATSVPACSASLSSVGLNSGKRSEIAASNSSPDVPARIIVAIAVVTDVVSGEFWCEKPVAPRYQVLVGCPPSTRDRWEYVPEIIDIRLSESQSSHWQQFAGCPPAGLTAGLAFTLPQGWEVSLTFASGQGFPCSHCEGPVEENLGALSQLVDLMRFRQPSRFRENGSDRILDEAGAARASAPLRGLGQSPAPVVVLQPGEVVLASERFTRLVDRSSRQSRCYTRCLFTASTPKIRGRSPVRQQHTPGPVRGARSNPRSYYDPCLGISGAMWHCLSGARHI
jgi:hypothetical protein